MNDDKKAFKKLAEDGAQNQNTGFNYGVKTQSQAVGSSGTEIYSGYYSEEYLAELTGIEAAKAYDKMRRSEAQIAMLLAAIMNPIKSANWEIEDFSQDENHVAQADLIRSILFDSIDFDTFKHEALSMVTFGYSAFEVVNSVVINHPEFGTFNGLKALGFRSQKTIQSWNLEKKTGRIISIDQWAQGDIGDRVSIPGEFLIVFTNLKEGDNYEGISALRPMFGAYKRKQLYLKLTAIGVEKYAVGVPIGTVPAGKENSKAFEDFKALLSSYTSHEQAYITVPEGWTIEIQKGEFDADKIVELLKFENTEMVNAVVANFLALGTNGSGGAFALSNDLSDFFTSGIQSYADVIAGVINRKLIPELCKMNFGQLDGYPKLKVTGISDKAGKELADIVKILTDAKTIKPDMPLEEYLRRQYKLPKADPDSAAPELTPAPAPANSPELAQPQIKLAEVSAAPNDYTKLIEAGKTETKALMQARLKIMADALKKKLIEKFNAARTDAAKIEAPTAVEIAPEMIAGYKLALQNTLAKTAALALAQAEKETKRTPAKFTETLKTIKLAAPVGAGFYQALPPLVRKAVETQATLIAESQAADITKIVTFQFNSSETGTENPDQIDQEIDDTVNKTLEGDNSRGMSVDAAAGNSVAKVASAARTEHFFTPEVLSEIESFTFENNDPVAQICIELAGTTFAPDDPQVATYTSPLHPNCKSRMTANIKGTDAPPISGPVEITDAAKKSMTLCEH
jgi:hypothetical protein